MRHIAKVVYQQYVCAPLPLVLIRLSLLEEAANEQTNERFYACKVFLSISANDHEHRLEIAVALQEIVEGEEQREEKLGTMHTHTHISLSLHTDPAHLPSTDKFRRLVEKSNSSITNEL